MKLTTLANLDHTWRTAEQTPEENEARAIAAENIATWGKDVIISERSAHYLLEIIVGIAHSAYIAGQAHGMMEPMLRDGISEVFLEGIEEGKRIERQKRGDT